MKKTLLVSLCLVLSVALVASLAFAKNSNDRDSNNLKRQAFLESTVSLDQDVTRLNATAAQGTLPLAYFTFDSGPNCVIESWTSVDITSQLGDFWHVEDFAGMSPNYQGNVGVITGNQSLWCGVRASTDNPFCGYQFLPGYGNNWNQTFCTTACVNTGAGAVVSFGADWDSEPGYDATTLEVTNCTAGVSDENWITLAGGTGDWDGNLDDFSLNGDTVITVAIDDSLHTGGSLRVRLHFTADGAWSDQDGLWDTDGAIAIDDLSLTTLATETFEGETVGDTGTLSGNWDACTPPGYGDFAAVYSMLSKPGGGSIVQEDVCNFHVGCVWVFWAGSTADYGCGGWPGQEAVPYENLRGQYIHNELWSPEIPLLGSGVVFDLVYDVYYDTAIDPLIFHVWSVRSIVAGCAGTWFDRNFVYYGDGKNWGRTLRPFGDLVEPGASDIQLAIGARDMCPFWCGSVGSGNCHAHGPLIDNAEVYRVQAEGAQWSVRDLDLFQDTFATDGTLTGTARIDAANDILPYENLNFRPGDSTVVRVADPEVGLATDVNTSFGAAVYAWIGVWGPTAASVGAASGANLTQNTFRWPVVASEVDGDGQTWYKVRLDTSFTGGGGPGERTGASPDAFAIDLNDDLFVPGDTVCFVFSAINTNAIETYWTFPLGNETDKATALANPSECTILPAGGHAAGGDILYVDGMNGRGAQQYFDTAFQMIGIYDEIDRYDIRGPSSGVVNRPGARVTDVFQQLLGVYKKIIWNTGNLDLGLIGDGTTQVEKSDDAGMLLTFLDNLAVPGGVYFNGDGIAEEWVTYTNSAIPLRDTYIQHTLIDGNHRDLFFDISPLVIGESGSGFDHITGPDTLVAYGGCAGINDFDVIAPAGPSTQEMKYDGGTPGQDGAVISQYTLNTDSVTVGVVLSGFSYHYIRDDAAGGGGTVPDRVHHLRDILVWLGNQPPVPTPATPTYQTTLSQNYPNPFNPQTTIDFTVKELAPVSVKIYNVRGQLVKTLVNDTRTPGIAHRVVWDGRNSAGQQVSSGVYFYKLVTTNFTQTKKMVLLK